MKADKSKPKRKIKGPLDGTPHEQIVANMGIKNYPMWIPINQILKQIDINKKRTK